MLKYFYTLFFVIICNNLLAQAPNSFTFIPTNLSAIFNGQAQINGNYISSGDWIAAFDSSGNCCGANQIIMNNGISYINLVIYGDDPISLNIDEGMNSNEDFTLQLYQSSSGLFFNYPSDTLINSFSGWQNTNGTPLSQYNDINIIYNFITTQNISFNLNISLCENDAPVALTGGYPAGGVYIGPGVLNGVFSPSISGSGQHQIAYILNSDTAYTLINVNSLPDITLLTTGPFCSNESSIVLSSVTSGGVYSGSGVINNLFNPDVIGPGSYWINYSLIDSNSCVNVNQTLVSVYVAPNKPLISQNLNILTCSENNVNYQWLDANYDSIPLANFQTFIPSSNGLYYVIISNSNCFEISDSFSFSVSEIENVIENNLFFDYKNLMFTSDFFIDKIIIYDINGKIVTKSKSSNVNLKLLGSGIYFAEIFSLFEKYSLKIIL